MSFHPIEFSFLTPVEMGAAYEQVCSVAGLEPTETGWGLLHVVDDNDDRWTLATDDPDYIRLLIEGNGVGALKDLEIPVEKFRSEARPGWPDDWAGVHFAPKYGRNDPCPCGSGKKFKYCHLRSYGKNA